MKDAREERVDEPILSHIGRCTRARWGVATPTCTEYFNRGCNLADVRSINGQTGPQWLNPIGAFGSIASGCEVDSQSMLEPFNWRLQCLSKHRSIC